MADTIPIVPKSPANEVIGYCKVNPYIRVGDEKYCHDVSILVSNNSDPQKCGTCPSEMKLCAACVCLSSNPLRVTGCGEQYCEFHQDEENRILQVPDRPRYSAFETMNMHFQVRKHVPNVTRHMEPRTRASGAANEAQPAKSIRYAEDDSVFDQESAAAYIREYLVAPRNAKPSVRRMYEAVTQLVQLVDPLKRRVAEMVRVAQIPSDHGWHVIHDFMQLGRVLPLGWQLVRAAESSGKRISTNWLLTLTASDAATIQPRSIRSKARELGLKI